MRHFQWQAGKAPSQAWRIAVYKDLLVRKILSLMDYWAPQIESEAKDNAVWTDRTGNARQTLASFAYISAPDVVTLILRQTMTYGKFLELRFDEKYAIVMRTLEQHYGSVWGSVKDLVE